MLLIDRRLVDKKVIDACVLLLGYPPRRVSAAFVQALDVALVRRAWRRLAVATHPDAVRRGSRGATDGRQFVEASRAYELLMSYLLSRPSEPRAARRPPDKPPRRTAPERPTQERPAEERHGTGQHGPGQHGPGQHGPGRRSEERPGTERPKAERPRAERTGGERHSSERHGPDRPGPGRAGSSAPLFYRGPIPRRRLRLAEFLYYTGRVSWQSLISALVWQRSSQPRFGELARELRNISAVDLSRILGSRLRQEYTGEAARRLQLLTSAQVDRILRLQRARRRLIGRYFVENERMSSSTLTSILFELYRHNARWGRAG